MQVLVDNRIYEADVEDEMPLLWLLRDELAISSPKYGCGIAQCGACTVHVGGEPVRSCQMTVGQLAGRPVLTIEGLGTPDALHPVQAAWIEHQVAQCGYCQSGQIMSAVALLARHPQPSGDDIDRGMSANLCRCATYPRIRAAIRTAAQAMEQGAS